MAEGCRDGTVTFLGTSQVFQVPLSYSAHKARQHNAKAENTSGLSPKTLPGWTLSVHGKEFALWNAGFSAVIAAPTLVLQLS